MTIVVTIYLPDFAFTDGLDCLLDSAVDQLVFHALLDQLDQFLAHFVTGKRLGDWGDEKSVFYHFMCSFFFNLGINY